MRRALALVLGLAACSGGAPPVAAPDAAVDALDAAAVDALDDAVVDAAGSTACRRPLAVERVEDLGAFSLPSPTVLSRDGVSSGAFRGRLVWTFGDAFLTRPNPLDGSSVLSATAGWSDPSAPLALDEPTDDAGLPQQLIPYSADELRANRDDALNGWALWPGAPIDTGGGELLVLFQRVRRTRGAGFDSVAVGTARLAAGATLATRDPGDLFAREGDAGLAALYGSGGASVVDGHAYLFACANVGFLNQGCRVARAPVAQADRRAAYAYFDGAAWSADPARAAVFIDHVGGGVSVSRNPHLGCYLAVTGALLRSAVVLRAAERLEGPWGAEASGVTVPATADGPILPAAPDAYDYLFLEHPALRSPDGREVVISYARPLGNFRGEVRLARITLR